MSSDEMSPQPEVTGSSQPDAPITGAHAGERVVAEGAEAAQPGYGDPAGPLSPEPVQPVDTTPGSPR